MARQYAGVLGLLAFVVTTTRGLVHGPPASATLLVACVALFGFAAAGWILGRIADSTVTESVKTKMNAAIEDYESRKKLPSQDGAATRRSGT